MRAVWKDGLRNHRRDRTVHLRGINGREMGPAAGFYGWEEMIAGPLRRIIQRQVHKGSRQAIKSEIPALVADGLWVLWHMEDEIWRTLDALDDLKSDESSLVESNPFSSLLSRYDFDDYDYGAAYDYSADFYD